MLMELVADSQRLVALESGGSEPDAGSAQHTASSRWSWRCRRWGNGLSDGPPEGGPYDSPPSP
jgi:hypothetical protein